MRVGEHCFCLRLSNNSRVFIKTRLYRHALSHNNPHRWAFGYPLFRVDVYYGIVALIYRDGAGRAFTQTFIVTVILGLMLWFPNRNQKQELKSREGFLIVVLFWTVLGSVGALPFLFEDSLGMSVTNAFLSPFQD